ncbi:MAG: helix-turn-helix domain-containing protein [Solirubrobacterales bacterium]
MLGDNIRNLRKLTGLSINKLSKDTGISLGYLSDLENNKFSNPTLDKLKTIADRLGVTVEDFFKDDSPIIPKSEDELLNTLTEENRLLFKKIKSLPSKDAKKILNIIDLFEKENNI